MEDESDDELGEESLLETPLDKIEPYQLFRDALMSRLKFKTHLYSFTNAYPELQQEQPQLYGTLTTNLSPDEQTVVQNVVHQAEANAAQALLAQQQAALAANGTA